MDVEASLQQINQELAKYSFGSQPEELYQPLHYIMGIDRKRSCPLLTFWGCYLYSGETNNALLPSLGVEVFYNFLMVLEDLLDGSRTRNGHQSVQVKWNDNVAILSGDAMIFKVYELLIQVDSKLIKPVIRLFNPCFTRICESKQLILNLQGSPIDEHDYQKILQLKPGALTEFSLQLGAMIGGATVQQAKEAGQLGNTVGKLRHLHEAQSELNSDLLINGQKEKMQEQLGQLDCDIDRKSKFGDYLDANYG